MRTRGEHVPDASDDGDIGPDNRIALVDQGLFAGHRAAGLNLVIQCIWRYQRPVDLDGLRRYHHNLAHGFLGRRIELSPLPFARPRWVVDRGPADIDVAPDARPPAEVSDWADARSQLPIDPENGPGWHFAVLPLTDGTTAVSLVLSHYVLDGLGLALALTDAAHSNTREFGYPPPRSRTRRRAVVEDARQSARDLRAAGRALVTAAKLARKQAQAQGGAPRRPAARSESVAPSAGAGGGDTIVVPAATMHIDLDQFDARAQSLGATRYTLVAGVAAKYAQHLGRTRADDGVVTLHLPISGRVEGQARANAMSIGIVTVDPTRLTTDMSDLRVAVRQALKKVRETPDETLELRPLIPFTPKRALKRMVDMGFTDPARPILCSNLGDLGSAVRRLDGTDGAMVLTRATGQNVTRSWLDQIGGQMTLQSWHIDNTIYLTINAYEPGAENTKPALRELARQMLAEFGLTGKVD